jgi:hypothetical protein
MKMKRQIKKKFRVKHQDLGAHYLRIVKRVGRTKDDYKLLSQ